MTAPAAFILFQDFFFCVRCALHFTLYVYLWIGKGITSSQTQSGRGATCPTVGLVSCTPPADIKVVKHKILDAAVTKHKDTVFARIQSCKNILLKTF